MAVLALGAALGVGGCEWPIHSKPPTPHVSEPPRPPRPPEPPTVRIPHPPPPQPDAVERVKALAEQSEPARKVVCTALDLYGPGTGPPTPAAIANAMIANGLGQPPPVLAREAADAVSELTEGQAIGVLDAACLL